MPETDRTHEGRGTSRRAFLTGGLAGGAAAGLAALAGCSTDAIGTAREVTALPVGRLPLDPGAPAWRFAPATAVALDGQTTAPPVRPKPSLPAVRVQSLYDAERVGFRVSWAVERPSPLAIRSDEFRDACAVLLAPDATNVALRFMGTADTQVTILHWKADWQRDADRGRQGLAAAYPNASADYYPPLPAGSGATVTIADYRRAGATEWLPGLHVGNPLSAETRPSPVEKLHARGFGTAATAPTQDADGRGVWADGRWQVVLAVPRRPTDAGELALEAGRAYGMAVAVWVGAAGDRGGRKSPSRELLRLVLSP
jgi:hypothetical protein